MMRALFSLLACLSLLFSSCKKEPGEGGKAEIRGFVFRQEINSGTGQPVGVPYPYPEARVYIAYGDNDFYDDDVRTGPDGLYVFPWLRKGDYRVYTFGECNVTVADCPSGQVAILRYIEIGSKDEVVTVPTMTAENGW